MLNRILSLLLFAAIIWYPEYKLIHYFFNHNPEIFYPYSFVALIYTKTYEPGEVRRILDEFNDMGHKRIVKYDGIRPIFIIDQKFDKKSKGLGKDLEQAGEAAVGPVFCRIQLKPNMNPYELKFVLLHEYLHCYGYQHTKNPYDLMYPELPWSLTNFDAIVYATELEMKLHGK